MATALMSNKKKKSGLLSSIDIMKGFTSMTNVQDVWAVQPLQCIPLEEKTKDWVEWNANWHEMVALRELPKKATRLQKLYNLASGVINKSDYIYNPQGNDVSTHLGIIGVENEQTLLDQFFPIVPNIIQVFLGEQIKRDKAVIVDTEDRESLNEKLEYKEGLVRQALEQYAIEQKQIELASLGISEDNPATKDKYTSEMQLAIQLAEVETKFKKFRTIAERWAQGFIEKFGTRNSFDEKELDAFYNSLVVDEAIFALTMRETNFEVESLRPISTYVNISSNQKYYSKSNFIVNIEFMSIPDLINTFRNDLDEEQITNLEQRYTQTISSGINLKQFDRPDQLYNTSQSYDWNAQWSVGMRQEVSAKQARDFLQGAATNSGYLNYASYFTDIKKIRVSRIWWASQRRIGLLTKIEEGNPTPTIEQVDENFLITEKPIYDNSLLKEKTSKTLISGEHVEWSYVTEWRYVVKIGQNIPSYYKLSSNETPFETIYLYGDPIRFQFKGDENIYEAKPPVEGCRFSNINAPSVSLVEKIKPWQILYNILNNKVIRALPYDYGKVLVMGDSYIKRNSLSQEDGLEPVLEMLDSIKSNKTVIIDDSREASQQSSNRFPQPMMIDMSTIDQVALHLQTAQFVKSQAFESLGFSPQRMAQVGARETATGVQQGREASENQTEMHFELFSTFLIPKVWQMIIEAGQYYSTQSEDFSDAYLNSNVEREFFSVLKTDLLLRDLFVTPKSKADVRKLMSDLKQLTMQDNTMGATFLDKVKTFMSKSPSEIIEKLQKAEEERQQQEQSKFQQEQDQAKQLEEQKLAQEKEAMDREDARWNAKLENDRYIAELNADVAATPPDTSAQDGINYQKLQQQGEIASSQNDLANRKQSLAEKQLDNANEIEKEKIAQKQRDNQSAETVSLQNKNFSDLKFMQMQKNKAKAK